MRKIITRILSLSSSRASNTTPSIPEVYEQPPQEQQTIRIESSPAVPHSSTTTTTDTTNFDTTTTKTPLPLSPQVFHAPPTSHYSTSIPTPDSSKHHSLCYMTEMQMPPLTCSPHSKQYPSQLQQAVGSIAAALRERGRFTDSHGLQELYKQSFKDPGSAELLDALLRNRATERQKIDFERYIEDVSTLQVQEQDLTVIEASSYRSETKKRKPEAPEGVETGQEGQIEDTYGMYQLFSKRRKSEDGQWLSMFTRDIHVDLGRKSVLRRRQEPERRMDSPDRHSTDLDGPGATQDQRDFLSNTAMATATAVKRRRMTKMFHGANGPVYSRTLVL